MIFTNGVFTPPLYRDIGIISVGTRNQTAESEWWKKLEQQLCTSQWLKEKFENAAFRKRWRHDNPVIFLTEFSWDAWNKSKMNDCCVFKFLLRIVDGKRLMRFQSKKSLFKLFSQVLSPFANSLIIHQETKENHNREGGSLDTRS